MANRNKNNTKGTFLLTKSYPFTSQRGTNYSIKGKLFQIGGPLSQEDELDNMTEEQARNSDYNTWKAWKEKHRPVNYSERNKKMQEETVNKAGGKDSYITKEQEREIKALERCNTNSERIAKRQSKIDKAVDNAYKIQSAMDNAVESAEKTGHAAGDIYTELSKDQQERQHNNIRNWEAAIAGVGLLSTAGACSANALFRGTGTAFDRAMNIGRYFTQGINTVKDLGEFGYQALNGNFDASNFYQGLSGLGALVGYTNYYQGKPIIQFTRHPQGRGTITYRFGDLDKAMDANGIVADALGVYEDGNTLYESLTGEYSQGGKLFKKGGTEYTPSQGVKDRITKWEGESMKTNRSLEDEARDFYNALPKDVRGYLTQDALDALYSYSYNVGAGAFKQRVVPHLDRLKRALTSGKGVDYAIKAITDSMSAAKDSTLRGLHNRRVFERAAFSQAIQGQLNGEKDRVNWKMNETKVPGYLSETDWYAQGRKDEWDLRQEALSREINNLSSINPIYQVTSMPIQPIVESPIRPLISPQESSSDKSTGQATSLLSEYKNPYETWQAWENSMPIVVFKSKNPINPFLQ